MSIYLILENEVHDHEAYERYKEAVRPMVEAAGGEYLTRGGKVQVLAGEWRPGRVVMFRWPSREAMDAFFASPEYQPWRKLREGASETKSLLILDGLDET